MSSSSRGETKHVNRAGDVFSIMRVSHMGKGRHTRYNAHLAFN
jgi:hypothetical protein